MSKDPNKPSQVLDEENVPSGAEKAPPEKKGIMLSRRKMLGLMGIQVGAVAVAASNGFAAPKNFNPKHYNRGITPDELPNTKAWLVTDPTTCVGCRTCEIMCSLSHEGVCAPSLSRIKILEDPTNTLALYGFIPDICKQCNMADCYLACGYDALRLDKERGTRFIDPNKCESCGECFAACPWDMIVKNEDTGKYSKCDLCGGDPQCVKYCPASSIKFIELR
jgi:Fe-S-cluster-containing hydrogenase components 1